MARRNCAGRKGEAQLRWRLAPQLYVGAKLDAPTLRMDSLVVTDGFAEAYGRSVERNPEALGQAYSEQGGDNLI